MKKTLIFFLACLLNIFVTSQAITLSTLTRSIVIDNISDYSNDIEILALTNINVDASFGAGTNWDFAMLGGVLTSSQYVSQGSNLDHEDLKFRATNFCESPNAVAPANNINASTYSNLGNITWDAGVSNAPHYVVGSSATDGNLTGSCGATIINQDGNSNSSPESHNFRLDLQLDLSAFRTGTVINPGIYNYNILFQLFQDGDLTPRAQTSFSLEIEILPVLQLKTTTLDRIDFNFIEISNYINGLTQNNKTILEVSSNVNWDLLAIGTSVRHQNNNTDYFWDANSAYTSTGSANIPLSALEILQYPDNPCAGSSDYSSAFTNPPTQLNNNNISVASGVLSFASLAATGTDNTRCIAGNYGTQGQPANAIAPGSYYINGSWTQADYRYSLTYRLTPGLPATFQNGKPLMAQDAKSGYYSMQVRYIIIEDQ